MALASPESARESYQQELLAAYRTTQREANIAVDDTDSNVLNTLERRGINIMLSPANPEQTALAALGLPADFWLVRGFGAPTTYTLDPNYQATMSEGFTGSGTLIPTPPPAPASMMTTGGSSLLLSLDGLPTTGSGGVPNRELSYVGGPAGAYAPAGSVGGMLSAVPVSSAGIGGTGRVNPLLLVAAAGIAYYVWQKGR